MLFSNRNIHIPILIIILIAGVVLRFYRLDDYSIFFDEKSTMVVSQGIVLEGANQKEVFSKPSFTPQDFWAPKSFEDYCQAMTRSDIGNSPFYYLLLHLWSDVFGMSDFAVRSMSVLFSVLIILFTYLFGARFFSAKVGLIAAAAVAIEPFFIAYSHQARNYSLTFFLTLVSSWIFLRLVNGEYKNQKRLVGLYIAYGVVSGLCLMSHFLTVSVFLAHGLYVLFFLKLNRWPRIILAGLLALTGITWWMTMGGGIWTMRTLAYQAELYKEMALTNPYHNRYGIILPATISNVFVKSLPIFSDLIVFTNGLTDVLAGKKNVLISIFTGCILAVLYRSKKLPNALDVLLPALLLLAVSFIYTNHPVQFSILSVSVFALSFLPGIHRQADAFRRRQLWFLYLMALLPTFFLIAFAFKNGHTYGLTQRYSGFSFPYVIILLSLLLTLLWDIRIGFKVPLFLLLACQLLLVMGRLEEFYEDRSAKYGYFVEPRRDNPFYEAAQSIVERYAPGDTIFYPALPVVVETKMDSTFLPFSVQDAQLTNLYLPRDAQYIQVMNRKEHDKIILKRKVEGDCLTVVSLKGVRY